MMAAICIRVSKAGILHLLSASAPTCFVFRFTTSELSRVGDVIGQVKAVDKDTNSQSNVFYSITGGNEKGVL